MNAQFDHAPKSKSNQKKTTQGVFGSSMPSTVLVHAKLEMTTPGDSEELEADAMADSIVSEGKIARAVTPGHSGGGISLPSQFSSQIASLQGQGSQLYGDLKTKMEYGLGRDFSNVRFHTDSAAAEMSSSIAAKAFTYGNDIFFNRGQYNPDTKDGQHLIAHELTHVAQGAGRVARMVGAPITEEDYNKLLGREQMEKFVAEAPWLREKVLNYHDLSTLETNYYISDEERQLPASEKWPITIVILTSNLAACKDDLNQEYCAFEENNSSVFNSNRRNGPISSLLKNSKKERVLMIQAPNSISSLISKIEELVNTYGTIKDVVFRGHGNSNVLEIGNLKLSTFDDASRNNVSVVHIIDVIIRHLHDGVNHAIIFAGCLTDSDSSSEGFSEFSRDYLRRTYPNVTISIQGNEASVHTWNQSLDYDDKGNLKLVNSEDPTASTSDNELRDYSGFEKKGILRNMIGKLDPATRSKYKNPDSFEYNTSVFDTDDIKMTGHVGTTLKTITIDTGDLIKFVKNEVKNNPSQKSALAEFLKKIDYSDELLFSYFWMDKKEKDWFSWTSINLAQIQRVYRSFRLTA